jgi:transposase
MIGAQGRVPVFAYRRPADLRKGFEGLSALVREALAQDPLSGALYLFTNRRRTTAKVLHFDGTGLGLYIKRLARGRFASLWDDSAPAGLSLTRTELDLFLQGSHLVGKMALAPAPMSEKELVSSRARGSWMTGAQGRADRGLRYAAAACQASGVGAGVLPEAQRGDGEGDRQAQGAVPGAAPA